MENLWDKFVLPCSWKEEGCIPLFCCPILLVLSTFLLSDILTRGQGSDGFNTLQDMLIVSAYHVACETFS